MIWRIQNERAARELIKKRAVNPPPNDGILFIGSSILRLWTTLKTDMSPLPVFNQAFGGSRTWEVLQYTDKLVLPYQPRIIVYYCGSNDIDVGADAESIQHQFQLFAEYIATHLPKTRIYYLSIIRSPQKGDRLSVVDAANTLIEKYCYQTTNLEFIDLNPALVDEVGEPRLELYLGDRLHFKPYAYQEFKKVIKPILMDAWNTW